MGRGPPWTTEALVRAEAEREGAGGHPCACRQAHLLEEEALEPRRGCARRSARLLLLALGLVGVDHLEVREAEALEFAGGAHERCRLAHVHGGEGDRDVLAAHDAHEHLLHELRHRALAVHRVHQLAKEHGQVVRRHVALARVLGEVALERLEALRDDGLAVAVAAICAAEHGHAHDHAPVVARPSILLRAATLELRLRIELLAIRLDLRMWGGRRRGRHLSISRHGSGGQRGSRRGGGRGGEHQAGE